MNKPPPSDCTYEQMLDSVERTKADEARFKLLEQVQRDPGFPFRPDRLEHLAELRRSDPPRWHYFRGIFDQARVPVRDLDAALDQLDRAHGTNGAAPGALDVVWADDITLDIDKPGLVDGLLSTTAMTVAYGESGAGKTFVVLDLACSIAAGLPWRGHATEQGVVVYIAAEAPKSVERRVWAWMRHQRLEHLPLVVVRASINLLDGDTDTLIAELARIQAERGRIALVVVDTLARAMVGNENSPEDLGAFVTACARIREAATASVLIVHHTGKDQARGARGHSCLRAATDVELEITEGCIKVSKNRDGQEGQIYGFTLTEVELGLNAKGRMVTTCVAEEAEPPASAGNKRPLGPNEQLVLDALVKAIADESDPPPATAPSHARGCSVTRWQATAILLLPHPEEFRKREAFNRALPSLVSKKRVEHVAGFAWLP